MGTAFPLGELLALAALVAATVEYGEILKRRAVARRRAADDAALAESGLRGMVRVFLVEGKPGARGTS